MQMYLIPFAHHSNRFFRNSKTRIVFSVHFNFDKLTLTFSFYNFVKQNLLNAYSFSQKFEIILSSYTLCKLKTSCKVEIKIFASYFLVM